MSRNHTAADYCACLAQSQILPVAVSSSEQTMIYTGTESLSQPSPIDGTCTTSTVPEDVTDHKDDIFLIDTSISNDGGYLHYRFEGNTDISSPIFVFINDTLVNLHVWDPTVSVLKQRYPHYRFLRYGE